MAKRLEARIVNDIRRDEKEEVLPAAMVIFGRKSEGRRTFSIGSLGRGFLHRLTTLKDPPLTMKAALPGYVLADEQGTLVWFHPCEDLSVYEQRGTGRHASSLPMRYVEDVLFLLHDVPSSLQDTLSGRRDMK